MGKQLLDQYSLLHFCVGVYSYFWNVPFWLGFTIHFMFEILENTQFGMKIINDYFIGKGIFNWPGGKYKSDAWINVAGDNIMYAVGWFLARWIDDLGIKYGWYDGHKE